VLLLAGGGSIRANGVHAQVRTALGDRVVQEFWGVEANPDYDTLMRAVELVRRERLEWILAVGGGSVLDGAKFVAAAAGHAGDPWEILTSAGAKVTARRRAHAAGHGFGGQRRRGHQPPGVAGKAVLHPSLGLPALLRAGPGDDLLPAGTPGRERHR
jgi:hypothetical protein